MIDDVGRGPAQHGGDPQFTNWRVVISAWVIVVIFVLLLSGAKAVACLHGGLHHHRELAGAVIPRHHACAGPGIASAPGLDGCKNLPVSEDRSAYW